MAPYVIKSGLGFWGIISVSFSLVVKSDDVLGGFGAVENSSKSPNSDTQRDGDGDRGVPTRIQVLLLVVYENIPLSKPLRENFISLLEEFAENTWQSIHVYNLLTKLFSSSQKKWISCETYSSFQRNKNSSSKIPKYFPNEATSGKETEGFPAEVEQEINPLLSFLCVGSSFLLAGCEITCLVVK